MKKRGRGWRWRVCTTARVVVMQGFESIRTAANYKADRALFQLLLSAPYRSVIITAISTNVHWRIASSRFRLRILLYAIFSRLGISTGRRRDAALL